MKKILQGLGLFLLLTFFFVSPGFRACDKGVSFGFPMALVEVYQPESSRQDWWGQFTEAKPAKVTIKPLGAGIINLATGLLGLFFIIRLLKSSFWKNSRIKKWGGYLIGIYICMNSIGGACLLYTLPRLDTHSSWQGFIESIMMILCYPILWTYVIFNNEHYKLYEFEWEKLSWYPNFYFHHDDLAYRITLPLSLGALFFIGCLGGWMTKKIKSHCKKNRDTPSQ